MLWAFLAILCGASAFGEPVKVALGDQHGLWLKGDGTVWEWSGREGAPVRVPELSAVRDNAAGGCFSVAVKRDGTLKIWGRTGGLGDAASIRGVTRIAAAGEHVLALGEDGSLWEWGMAARGPASALPRRVEGIGRVTAIAASAGHSAAVSEDGGVWLWGDHGAGDLGNGDYGYAGLPRNVRELSNVAAVAAGYQFTIALKKDRTVWAIGYGAAGQLGNGAKESSTQPVQVKGLSGVRAVAAGRPVNAIECDERPEMFADYLRRNLTCDTAAHGTAGCEERPYRRK